MNKEDIKQRMADAGLKLPARGDFIFIHWDQIALLIEHERKAEREACAKVCDELHWPWHMGDNSGPKECAAAIRARGCSSLCHPQEPCMLTESGQCDAGGQA